MMDHVKEWLKESSTIRGIMLILGAVTGWIGWALSPDELEILTSFVIGLIWLVVYGAYQLFRKDSAKKESGFINLGLLVLVLSFVLVVAAFIVPVHAADVYVSVEGTVTSFKVITSDAATGDELIRHEDITGFEALGPDDEYGGTRYRVENADYMPAGIDLKIVLEACNQGWCSVSDPLFTGRPTAQNLKIR